MDYFPYEFHGTTTELQHSIAIGLIFCIFPTKYAIEFKKGSTISIAEFSRSPVLTWNATHEFMHADLRARIFHRRTVRRKKKY